MRAGGEGWHSLLWRLSEYASYAYLVKSLARAEASDVYWMPPDDPAYALRIAGLPLAVGALQLNLLALTGAGAGIVDSWKASALLAARLLGASVVFVSPV